MNLAELSRLWRSSTLPVIWLSVLLVLANVLARLALGDSYMIYWRLIMLVNLPVMFLLIPYLMLSLQHTGVAAHAPGSIVRLALTVAVIAFTIAYSQSVVFSPTGTRPKSVGVVIGLFLAAFYAIVLMHMKPWVFKVYEHLLRLNANNRLTNALQFASAVLWYALLCLPFDAYDKIREHARDLGGLGRLAAFLAAALAIAYLAKRVVQRVLKNASVVLLRDAEVYTTHPTVVGAMGKVLLWDPDDDRVYQTMYPGGGEDARVRAIREGWEQSQLRHEVSNLFKNDFSTNVANMWRFFVQRAWNPAVSWLVRPEGDPYYRMSAPDGSRDGGLYGAVSSESHRNDSPFAAPRANHGDDEITRVHHVAFTISLWLYVAGHDEREEGNLLRFGEQFALVMRGGRPAVEVGDERVDVPGVARQRWHHVVLARDHGGRTNVFVDGALHATHSGAARAARDDELIYIGDDDGPHAAMKDVYYYGRVLSEFDVFLLRHDLRYLV